MQYVPGHRTRKSEQMRIEELKASELSELIDDWVTGKNAERDRDILKRRLIDGLTYERLSAEFDLSVRQVQNIIYKRQDTVFKHCR